MSDSGLLIPRRFRRRLRPVVERIVGPLDVPRRFRAIFRDIRAGDVAVDCGAHIGRITAALAARGAHVHAFEPNPAAHAVLRERFADAPSVTCHQAAVALVDGTAKLHLHREASRDPVGTATGSTLLTNKGNVDPTTFVVVQTVDLRRVLEELAPPGHPIALLKLDIEGVELDVLPMLHDAGWLESRRIRHVLVEMHDRSSAGGYVPAGAAIRASLSDSSYRHVRLDWD